MSDPMTRSRSFGAAAADYHRARTGYTVPDIAWSLGLDPSARAGASDVDTSRLRVLDLAAGTGRLTLALRGAGVGEVAAVEPDPGMRAEFAARVGTTGVTLHDGTAEAIPLPDASVDAVVAGSAFHWFDPASALPEIARVLRPGGFLTALWTHPDEQVGWVRAYRAAARAELGPHPEPVGARPVAADATARRRQPDRHSDIPASPLFTPTELRESVHEEPTDRPTLVLGVGTYSEILVADPERRAAALAAVAEAVQRVVPTRPADDSPGDSAVAGAGVGAVAGAGEADRVLLPVRVAGARCRRR